jgi:single-strand DNA-binding protein
MLKCSHMASVNKVILIGNLGKDAETRFTPSGVSVTNFNMATTRRWKDQGSGEWKEKTDWHRVVYWRAENVANYLLKGKQVYVEGRLETRSYDDKDGKKIYMTEVLCEHLVLLGSRGEGSAAPDEYSQQPVSMPRSASRSAGPSQSPGPSSGADEPSFNQGITDDDVPF